MDIYRTSWLPGLLFAMVVLAPVGEETLFRGFLYAGIAASRAGPVVAIIVSSVAFAAVARSIRLVWHGRRRGDRALPGRGPLSARVAVLTMLLHAVGNAFATLEMVVQEHWLK